MEAYQLLWAKSDPYKQLIAHMLDAGLCAWEMLAAPSSKSVLEFFAGQWHCSESQAISFASYIVALHDIGKATPQFQMNNDLQFEMLKQQGIETFFLGEKKHTLHHEYCSSYIVNRIWKQRGFDRQLIVPYKRILSIHHQRYEEKESDYKV